MCFLKKLRFWRRRSRKAVVTAHDIATMTDNFTSEAGGQVSYVEFITKCDEGTQTDCNLTREEVEETALQRKISVLSGKIAEKDRHIKEQSAMIEEMKHRTVSEIRYMKEEIEKTPLLRKIGVLNKVIAEKDRQIQKQSATIDKMKHRTLSEIEFMKDEIEKTSLPRLKKLHFWRRRRKDVTTHDIASKRDSFTSETGSEFPSVELIPICEKGTQTDCNATLEEIQKTGMLREIRDLSREIADKERHIMEQSALIEEMKRSTPSEITLKKEEMEMNPLLREIRVLREENASKDRHIRELSALIEEMKQSTLSEIKYMKEEIEKKPLLRQIGVLNNEIAERDRHIQKQSATIEEMKERTLSEIEVIKEEVETPLKRKITVLNEEIAEKHRRIQEQSVTIEELIKSKRRVKQFMQAPRVKTGNGKRVESARTSEILSWEKRMSETECCYREAVRMLTYQIDERFRELLEQRNFHEEEKRNWTNIEKALRAQNKGLKKTLSIMDIQIKNARYSKKVEEALRGQIKDLKMTISKMKILGEENKMDKLTELLESVHL